MNDDNHDAILLILRQQGAQLGDIARNTDALQRQSAATHEKMTTIIRTVDGLDKRIDFRIELAASAAKAKKWNHVVSIALKVTAAVAIAATLLILGLSCAGCSKRDQAIADSAASTREAASAIQQGAPAAKPAAAIKAQAQAIETATGKRGQPAATAAQWLDDEDQALAANRQQVGALQKLAEGWPWLAIGGTALLGVLAVGKKILPGLYGSLASMAYNVAAPPIQRELRARDARRARIGEIVVEQIEQAPPEITRPLKDVLERRMDQSHAAEVQSIIASLKAKKAQ